MRRGRKDTTTLTCPTSPFPSQLHVSLFLRHAARRRGLRIWYVSVPFEVVCVSDQTDEEDEDAPETPQQQRPLLAVDFGHTVWLEHVRAADNEEDEEPYERRQKRLRFVSLPSIQLKGEGCVVCSGIGGDGEAACSTSPCPSRLHALRRSAPRGCTHRAIVPLVAAHTALPCSFRRLTSALDRAHISNVKIACIIVTILSRIYLHSQTFASGLCHMC